MTILPSVVTPPWAPVRPIWSVLYFFLFLYFVWLLKCFSFDAFLFFSFANSDEAVVFLSMSSPPFATILW